MSQRATYESTNSKQRLRAPPVIPPLIVQSHEGRRFAHYVLESRLHIETHCNGMLSRAQLVGKQIRSPSKLRNLDGLRTGTADGGGPRFNRERSTWYYSQVLDCRYYSNPDGARMQKPTHLFESGGIKLQRRMR